MVALYVQVIALLAIAYLVGALLATIIRRSLHKPAVQMAGGERRVDPLPEYLRREAKPVAAPAPVARPQAIVTPQPAPEPPQDLKRIRLIDGATEGALSRAGVVRYAQIAGWTAADVARISKLLGIGDRISEENWIEQAQILSRGGDTAFSRQHDRDHGIAPPPAAAAPVLARAPAPALAAVPPPAEPEPARRLRGEPDDLKRIRGIGVLIEKKLNSMGITSYDAIANWTAGDIDRVSQSLDFKGRIERENWVEQARILTSGGATEFSRRVDRGEVETSRART